MRFLLLSSMIMFGLLSHASASCPSAETVELSLRMLASKVMENNKSDILNKLVQHLGLKGKYTLKPHGYLTFPEVPKLSLTLKETQNKNGKSICTYSSDLPPTKLKLELAQ